MKHGYLSQYFEAVAAKRLSQVEVNASASNQHEFNGSQALKQVLGTNDSGEKIHFPTRFIWMGEENETLTADGTLSWYDSRFGKPRNPEWRLYFPTTDVTAMAQPGDLLFVARRTNGTVLVTIASAGSTMENQLLWLFGVPFQTGKSFIYQTLQDREDKEVDFAVRFILEELGIDVEEPETEQFDEVIAEFKGRRPTIRELSTVARKIVCGVDALEDPDEALMTWMTTEEKLFRRMERYDVKQKLKDGFVEDGGTTVDGFLNYSLSIQNTRKIRAGRALENHLEEILKLHRIRFDRNIETEPGSEPHFLFPSAEKYQDPGFSVSLLTMLTVKITCKDRWLRVLNQAAKIPNKHLLTLEPGISENETEKMRLHNLQLVLPKSVHETYRANQRPWLMNIQDFVKEVYNKQSVA